MAKKKTNLSDGLIAMEAAEISTEREVQIFPAGKFRHPTAGFEINEETKGQIMKNFSRLGREMVIDYEHQSLSGDEAPAAGWVKSLVNRGKDGLWALVEWTARAKKYIEDREYRYLSPVLNLRDKDPRTGKQIGYALHSAALTNTPFLPGMQPVAAKQPKEKEENMPELKKIAEALGLKAEATEEEILACVAEREEKPTVARKEVLEALGCKENATIEEVKAGIVALKAEGKKEPDPAQYVPLKDFRTTQSELAAMKAERAEEKATAAVTGALEAGKITQAQKDWALKFAKKDLAGFEDYVKIAPQVVPMSELVKGKPLVGGGEVPDDAQLAVNKALGVDAETWKKYNPSPNM